MATFTVMTAEGPKPKTTDEIFKGKKVVLFAVPGAFTPTCHKNHLPGFVKNAAAIKAKGIDTIAVTGVNDVFVMDAWKKASGGDAHRVPGRRQRRLRQGARAHRGPDRARPRRALAALRHGGRRRRGEDAQRRGRARQGRGLRRRQSAQEPVDALDSHSRRGPLRRESGETGFVQALFLRRAHRPRSPRRASWSARSFISWPAWPLTQCQCTSWRCERGVEPLPEVDVLHRLLVGGLPAVALPAVNPLRDAVAAHIGCRCAARPCTAASAPPAPRSPPSAPCGCWWCAARRPSVPSRARRRSGSRPSRPARDCPSRRRRCG